MPRSFDCTGASLAHESLTPNPDGLLELPGVGPKMGFLALQSCGLTAFSGRAACKLNKVHCRLRLELERRHWCRYARASDNKSSKVAQEGDHGCRRDQVSAVCLSPSRGTGQAHPTPFDCYLDRVNLESWLPKELHRTINHVGLSPEASSMHVLLFSDPGSTSFSLDTGRLRADNLLAGRTTMRHVLSV